ncbi:hypothetical protein Taro_004391 [Colocasia esculenta]|uniref:Uncharacterized protein n=1 Tax=Colocasia esculenta TaxID=4460 RepID=A0A843TRJ2_COLES|nr:hypothetical protein [Colocasia esculenta]
MLTTSAVQTRSGFSPALISGVTRFVTVFAVTFCWSVGDEDLGFPILAGSLSWVERMLFAIGYNRIVDNVGIHDQRRLTEALCKGSLVRRKEYLTESSPQAK